MPEKPSTREMVMQIHNELVGINGRGGIVDAVREGKTSRQKIHEKIDVLDGRMGGVEYNIENKLMTKDECTATRKAAIESNKEEKQWSWKKRMGYFTLQVAVMSLLVGLLTFLLDKCGGIF